MTDIHLTEELGGVKGFEAAIEHVNSLAPDFIITGGDLVYDALDVPYEEAGRLYSLFGDLCEKFDAPVHNTIGNHEIFGLYDSTGVSRENEEFGKEMFRRRLGGGATSHSFDFGGWHFISLDVIGYSGEHSYMGFAGSRQLDWLKRDLASTASGTPIVLCVHIPLITVYKQIKKGHAKPLFTGEVVVNSKEVLDLFEGHDLRMVLQGHLHIVEQISFKGIHYVTGGAVCGAWWKGPRDGFPEGFVVVDIDGEEMNYRYETYGWDAERYDP